MQNGIPIAYNFCEIKSYKKQVFGYANIENKY